MDDLKWLGSFAGERTWMEEARRVTVHGSPWVVACNGKTLILLRHEWPGEENPEAQKAVAHLGLCDPWPEGESVPLAALRDFCGPVPAPNGVCPLCDDKGHPACRYCFGEGGGECETCHQDVDCDHCDNTGLDEKTACPCGAADWPDDPIPGSVAGVLVDRWKLGRALARMTGEACRVWKSPKGWLGVYGEGWAVVLMGMELTDWPTEPPVFAPAEVTS